MSAHARPLSSFGNMASCRVDSATLMSDAEPPPRNDIYVEAAKQRCHALADDWRSKGRYQDSSGETSASPTLAPDWRSPAPIEATRPAPARKKPLRIDTNVSSQYGVRRYRHTPIDSDLIASAPANTREHRPSLTPKAVSGLRSRWYLGTPREEAGTGAPEELPSSTYWVQMESSDTADVDRSGRAPAWPATGGAARSDTLDMDGPSAGSSSPWSLITPVDPQSHDSGSHFPLAEMTAIDKGKKLRTKGWDGMDSDTEELIRKYFHCEPAVGTGDEIAPGVGHGNVSRAGKAVLDDPAVQSVKVASAPRGQEAAGSDAAQDKNQYDGEKQARFDALIRKLHGSGDDKFHNWPPIDIKPPSLAKKHDAGGPGQDIPGSSRTREMSGDSAISGISLGGANKATPLNPRAPEFRSLWEGQTPAFGFWEANAPVQEQPLPERGPDGPSRGDLSVVLRRMEEMEAQLHEAKWLLKQSGQTGQPPLRQGQQVFPAWDSGMFAPPAPGSGPGLLAPVPMNNWGSSSMGGAPLSQNPQPAQSTLHCVPQVGAVREPGLGQSMPAHFGVRTEQIRGGNPRLCRPLSGLSLADGQNWSTGTVRELDPTYAQQHAAELRRQIENTSLQQPLPPSIIGCPPRGIQGQKDLTSMYVQQTFGPKPVRKPKPPSGIGDPQQAMQQQQYEAYLEWKRTSNTEYAQQCRARQARRAERQRSARTGSSHDEPVGLSLVSTLTPLMT